MVSYVVLASALFGWVFDHYEEHLKGWREVFLRADIKIPFRSYVAVTFLTAILVWIIAFLTIVVLAALGIVVVSALMLIVYVIFIPLLAALGTFTLCAYYPFHRSSSRRKDIEANLPFALTHMGSIAEAGVPPHITFRLISQFREYGELAVEMGKIAHNIEAFGMDPLTATREVAARTPSDDLKTVLHGFITTSEAGGDVKHYLRVAGERALFEWRMKREKFLKQLTAYAEFYTGIMIAAPLFIIALFAIMGMIQPTIAGIDIMVLTKISVYGLVPAINVGFLLFLKGVEVKI